MEKEEAIQTLNHINAIYDLKGMKKESEALTLAIESLEQREKPEEGDDNVSEHWTMIRYKDGTCKAYKNGELIEVDSVKSSLDFAASCNNSNGEVKTVDEILDEWFPTIPDKEHNGLYARDKVKLIMHEYHNQFPSVKQCGCMTHCDCPIGTAVTDEEIENEKRGYANGFADALNKVEVSDNVIKHEIIRLRDTLEYNSPLSAFSIGAKWMRSLMSNNKTEL